MGSLITILIALWVATLCLIIGYRVHYGMNFWLVFANDRWLDRHEKHGTIMEVLPFDHRLGKYWRCQGCGEDRWENLGK